MDKQQKKSEQLGNSPEEGTSNIGKWKDGRKWLKKLFPSRGDKTEAEIIQSLIRKKDFYECVKKLIALESETPLPNIDALYESLEKEMSQVILDSIVQVQEKSLIQVIKAVKKREKKDAKILQNEDMAGPNPKRPRKWRDKWRKWIEASVSHQITKALSIPTGSAAGSCLSQRFNNLGKTFKNDLIHVIRNLSPLYPPEFSVANLYTQCYHKYFVSEIGSITEYELTEEDSYFVLRWIHNIYPQTILRDPAVQGHIDESELESLLPPRMIRRLEQNFVTCEVDALKTFFEESLNLEEKRWKDGKEPTKVGRYYRSKLQAEVPQKYDEKIQRAAEISEKMSLKMAPLVGRELQKFLTRYQHLVVEYTQKKKRKCFMAITIANINCSCEFRDLLEDTRIESRAKENLSLRLHHFETLGCDVLLQDMFMKLKSRYKKLCHGKDRKQNFTDIMQYVRSCITSLKPLCQPCFQVVIGKIHFQVVLQYVTRLLENPVRFKDPIQLQTVARQIVVNATRINGLFSTHNSQETWLYPLLQKLAEIIGLEKLQDIIHNISELAEEYTDIGTEHIIAILHIKGNIDRPQAASALEQIQYRTRREVERADSAPLFSLIIPFSSEWLLCDNSRRRESGVCKCILAACMSVEFTYKRVIDFWCKKLNVDTPPQFYPHNPAIKIPRALARKICQKYNRYQSQFFKLKLVGSGQHQYSYSTFPTSHIDL